VKTQKWPREVDFKLPGFLVEVRGLLGFRYVTSSPSTPFHLPGFLVEVRGLLGFRYVTSSPSTPFHWLFEYDRRQ
jgi:hypothetical protein